jgi:signal peptidase I
VTAPRRAWLAALLSLATPGLGHLYDGTPLGGAVAYVLLVISVWLLSAAWLFVPVAPANIILGLAVFIAVYVGIPAHAALLARKRGGDYQLRRYNRWYVYLAVVLLAAFVMGPGVQRALHSWVEAFRIPTASMEPTLRRGDYLYVSMRPATPGNIQDGSLVVFLSVEEPGLKLTKRVIGMPGDTVEMKSGRVRVNGDELDEPYVSHDTPGRSEAEAQREKMRSWQLPHAIGVDSAAYLPDVGTWGPIIVPPDSFFSLGDNRDASYDSRYYGFVPFANVIGRPRVIYFSVDAGHVRWSRVGLRLE